MEKSKKLQKSYFDVLGLCCSSEVPLIENILKPLEGIKEVSVIVPSRTVIVLHDTLVISQLQIVKALNQARLEANMRVYGEEKQERRWPSPYSIASGVLLLLSFLKFVYNPLKYLALGAVAVGIYPIILKAIVSIRNLRLDVSILMIIAVIGTIAMDDYLEAGTIVFLFSIAEWLESRASHKANAAMSSLMNLAPQKAVIAETGEVVDADEVKVNTILAVKAGEVIPIDGVVLDGTCEVDEKTLTGESFPVAKQKDSTVWAGTINLNGYISVKTTALAEDCVVAKMAKLVEEAQNSKTSVQSLIDKFAKFYTPVATFCAYTRAATSGLLIKGGHHLETLAKIKVMAFDKTGTITKGEFVVTQFQSLSDDIDLNTLLYWVSSVESKSSHPLAAAIVDYGRSLSVEPVPEKVTEFENFPGEGICGKIEDRVIYIGNKRISARAGSETVPILQGEIARGKTTGYIYLGATPVGFFSLSDVCRLGVQEAIGKLKSLGIKTAMLTGDGESAAMQAQEQLGHSLELVHAELLPEDKVKIISAFKTEGPTAMIGDGINDAPALAAADIGISMGISGSALASETGNIILMSNDIRKIPEAIKLARKARRKVIENILLSISTKAAIIGLAIGGYPLVWAAVVADVGTYPHKCASSQRSSSTCPPACSSNSSLGAIVNHCKTMKGHDQCKGSDEFHEHDHCHHGGCDKNQDGIHKHDTENHLNSRNLIINEEDNHAVAANRHGHCAGHKAHGTKHCHHQHVDMVAHGEVLHSSPGHLHLSRQKEGQQHANNHCHSIPCCENLKDPESRNVLHSNQDMHHKKPGCSSDLEKHGTGEISIDIIIEHVELAPMHGCSSLAEKEKGSCCEGCSETCENLPAVCGCECSNEREDSACCRNECSSKECKESPIMHVCLGLDKREFGGCCKSYMKECCGKLGHSRAGFVGGLSEIMTESV
ncbi:unnamed protein product [Sphenostylis stenocarpa]|uniref:HMA domain-containing protein n=1 Tax=Sphenostylis stenocarpa TaxID=92480 RepID=A0AA86S7B0_9FABA|nr:unnamed protein product [Sphenostylis stenocarpa]